MPELEDFQLGTLLDLNMAYYLLGFYFEFKEIIKLLCTMPTINIKDSSREIE